MPKSYRVVVIEIDPDQPHRTATEGEPIGFSVFTQTFPEADFDMQALVLALNRRRRNRKARGKEVTIDKDGIRAGKAP